MEDVHKEIEALRAANRILAEENAQLSERAEDAVLLAQLITAIESVEEPDEIIDRMLERFSFLKDLPFVTCGRLQNVQLERISVYTSLSDDPEFGYPLELRESDVALLATGPLLIGSVSEMRSGFPPEYQPGEVLLLPFHSRHHGKCIVLVCGRPGQKGRLSPMVFLLNQAVKMVATRLDNVFLSWQLALFNARMEERVFEKTRDLHKAHDRLLTILHGIDNYIHITDTASHRLLFANAAAKRLFGADIEGKECFRVLRQHDGVCEFCKIPQLLAAQEESQKVIAWESFNPLTGRWFLNYERIIDWPDAPQALLTVGADISAVKKVEEEKQLLSKRLHQAQKMEAIGILAGSIAHDLNNILSGVVSYPDLLLATLPDDSRLYKGLINIKAAGQRAAKIVQGLLTLSRRGVQVNEVVDLVALAAEFVDSAECRDILEKHPQVRIVGPAGEERLPIMGSPAHLASVLMNLVLNAAEAMPGGGEITISLERHEFPGPPPGFTAWRAGYYVRLSVRDTGEGIPTEYVEKIFDPFFSRKTPGSSGTGLGLAAVWGTIAEHMGYIDVQTREGKGTTFDVYLPLTQQLPIELKLVREAAIKQGQGKRVLVVDDDPDQRRITSEILTYLGYTALSVASGEEAVQLLEEEESDLLLLDMLMSPGMDGLDTYERIRAFRPAQKVIIVSGYSRSDRVKKALALGVKCFLQKPYSVSDLGEMVRDVLTDDKI